MSRLRAVVIVTEGASPELLDRWHDELPGFDRLRRQGAWGEMSSGPTPYEPPGLLSAFTGAEPDEHGVFSYWAVHSPTYEPTLQDSGTFDRKFLWHRPEFADVPVAVINVFGTHPVQPVNGQLISYPMAGAVQTCHPRNLPVRLAKAGRRVVHDLDVWYSGQPKAEFADRVLAADRARAEAALHLLDGGEEPQPELLVINLTAIDRLSHFYWQELEDHSPVAPEDQAVRRAYLLADEMLGRFLDRVDDRTSVLAFSEIGFGPLRSYVPVNDFLEAAGLLTRTSKGGIDWERTRAFESVQGSQGVNLNLAGRNKHGTVDREQVANVLGEVEGVLAQAVNPRTGLPFLADVHRREDLYHGGLAQEAPDLLLFPADWRYQPLGDDHWARRVNRTMQSGWHRRESYWGGAGAAFTRDASAGPARLTAVAPTVLRMLGRDPLPGMPDTGLGSI